MKSVGELHDYVKACNGMPRQYRDTRSRHVTHHPTLPEPVGLQSFTLDYNSPNDKTAESATVEQDDFCAKIWRWNGLGKAL